VVEKVKVAVNGLGVADVPAIEFRLPKFIDKVQY
jgi:hypothetical protein